jgi:hypothetical protein
MTSWLTPFGDGGAGGVPQGAGVVPVAVQLEHGVRDVLDAAVPKPRTQSASAST